MSEQSNLHPRMDAPEMNPDRTGKAGRLRSFLSGHTAFVQSENGAMMPFGLTLMFLMMMMGGMAVDLMRYEEKRTAMQQTLDRSVLAAASLSQRLNPESVVRDYFAKAGMTEFLRSVNVNQGLNFREIRATTIADTEPFFMHLVGVDDLKAGAGSQAEQRISNVEISLVLDVSGSMQDTPTRITTLKSAARDFVSDVLTNNTNLVSVSVVPYAGQVNLGPQVFNAYTGVTFKHGLANSNCIDIPATTYTTTGIPPTGAYPQSGFYDTNTGYSTYAGTDLPNPPWYDDYRVANQYHYLNASCEPSTYNIVRPLSNNITQLQNQISALRPNGSTSIEAGMKWGTALLDPGSRPIVNTLIGQGVVPAVFSGRPANYADPANPSETDSMKVVVLMTDGQNTEDTVLADAFRIATSNVYLSNGDNRLSIRHPTGRPSAAGTNEYWVPHLCNEGYSGGRYYSCLTRGRWQAAAWNSGSGTTRLTWNKVWERATVPWVAQHLYARALAPTGIDARYASQMAAFRTPNSPATKNTRLQNVCSAAKNAGIIVFGVAFEATADGQTQVRNCASSTDHYFAATGDQLRDAFRAISSQISYLRLTQ